MVLSHMLSFDRFLRTVLRQLCLVAPLIMLLHSAYGQTLPLPVKDVFGVGSWRGHFYGPFPSWANLKKDYGAKGNGLADDTAALQQALDDLGTPGYPSVLYIPSGTYLVTSTLTVTNRWGIAIIGQDPSNTTLLWRGEAGGDILLLNGFKWSRISRLTFDGDGSAGAGINSGWDGAYYDQSENNITDCVFTDLQFGIRFGTHNVGVMDTDVPIIRCRFIRCSHAGISVESFNALQYWVWYSQFIDCNIGISNATSPRPGLDHGAGNFFVYRSLFLRSRATDFSTGNTGFFSLRENTSYGSSHFYWVNWYKGQNGSNLTLQDNHVYDSLSATPIESEDLGPYLLLDNVFRTSSDSAPILSITTSATQAQIISLGNTYTSSTPFTSTSANTRVTSLEDRVAIPSSIPEYFPVLPTSPQRFEGKVVEVPAGAGVGVVQRIVNEAAERAQRTGERVVVHFPQGDYIFNQTLVVPANVRLVLVGDGPATRLMQDSGDPAQTVRGPLLLMQGPNKASVRDLFLWYPDTGVEVTNADQSGARISMEHPTDGLQNIGPALWADGLNHAEIKLYDAYIGQVLVDGGPELDTASVSIFGGDTTAGWGHRTANLFNVEHGAKLLMWDIWEEGWDPNISQNYGNAGSITVSGANLAPYFTSDEPLPSPIIDFADGFQGRATFLEDVIDGQVDANNTSPLSTIVFAGCTGQAAVTPAWFQVTGPSRRVSFFDNVTVGNPEAPGDYQAPDQGDAPSESEIDASLSDLRTLKPDLQPPLPNGVTDLKMTRVAAEGARTSVYHILGIPNPDLPLPDDELRCGHLGQVLLPGCALSKDWIDIDVGYPPTPGSAVFQGNTLTLSGSSVAPQRADFDQGNLLLRRTSGNLTISGEILERNGEGGSDALTGLAVKEDLSPHGAGAFVIVTAGKGVAFKIRPVRYTGWLSIGEAPTPPLPFWLRLQRSGSSFTGSYSMDGTHWVSLGTASVPLPKRIWTGLWVNSDSATQLAVSEVKQVLINKRSIAAAH